MNMLRPSKTNFQSIFQPSFQLSALALSALMLANPVWAQSPPPINQAVNEQNADQYEPPGRIARVGYSFGNISFADAGSNVWGPLIPNRPISSGDSVFVADNGRAELQIGANALRLHERTRLSLINLTDDNTQLQLSQGTLVFRVRAMQERENIEVNTPNLRFSIQEPGEYRINVNDDNTTTVIVRHGLGVAQGDRDVVSLRSSEQTRFAGTNLNHTQIVRVPPFDTFDQWAADRDRAEDNSLSARFVPRDMVGYQQLDEYGGWETHLEFGAIWYPRGVSVGWAPYRDGQWVWVAPWGWTWVDRSPWGFAPYHYGRWAFVGKRWGWIPGRFERHQRPIYAPALVAFVGVGSGGLSAGISLQSRTSFGPSVAWFPLGPGEVYRPYYTRNTRYIQNLNQTVIINKTTVINRGGRNERNQFDNEHHAYRNQFVHNAVTSVPTQTFVRGEHVFPAASSVRQADVKNMRVHDEGPNLTPDRNNRFGDARPRNWQENDQFRGRPVVTGSNRNDLTQSNDGAPNNRPTNVPNQRQNPRANNSGLNNGLNNGANNGTNNATNDRYNGNPSRFDRPAQIESRNPTNNLPAQTTQAAQAVQTPVPVTSSSGIRTTEEMNADRGRDRNENRIRTDRFDPTNQAQRERSIERQIERPVERPIERTNERTIDRADDSSRAVINQPRQDPIREYRTMPVPSNTPANPSAAVPVSRPVETMNERSVERRPERSFERPERIERAERAERGIERQIERPQAQQREMPQPRQEVRAVEPRFVAPEVRREAAQPVKAERQEREKGAENKKENKKENNER
ncbi:DUF6600 domain-containing protein [Undibacterium flavidum]|uniref:FecR protein domain-containing protein n=1 Tax=Undibacterium flavidum TaxID=2762297 RepID=A0ABR6YGI6_9BURK|nr:DUF6600 domain-containing protein [Undibacterium flavidum]MBC3875632.1 hypothetical protein [Undibacterium flavidum]